MIESAVFRSNHKRYVYLKINECERCHRSSASTAPREHELESKQVGPRFSNDAGRMLTLCGPCSY